MINSPTFVRSDPMTARLQQKLTATSPQQWGIFFLFLMELFLGTPLKILHVQLVVSPCQRANKCDPQSW